MLKKGKFREIAFIVVIVLFFIVPIGSYYYSTYVTPKRYVERLSQMSEKQISSITRYSITTGNTSNFDKLQLDTSDYRYTKIIKVLKELKNLKPFETPSKESRQLVGIPKHTAVDFEIKTTLRKPLDKIYLHLDDNLPTAVSIVYTDYGLFRDYNADIFLQSNEKTSQLIQDIIKQQ